MKKSTEEIRSLRADLSIVCKITEAVLTKCNKIFDLFYNHIEIEDDGDDGMSVTTSEKSEANTTSEENITSATSALKAAITDTSTQEVITKTKRIFNIHIH